MNKRLATLPADLVRFASDESSGTFSGYACVFGVVDTYGTRFAPGAFKKSLAKRAKSGGPAMLWAHDLSAPIGVWTELTEDNNGLKVTGRLVTEIARGAEALALLKAGAVTGLSVGFFSVADERLPDGGLVFTEVDLVEISLTALPANDAARISDVKSLGHSAGVAAFETAVRRAAQHIKDLNQ
jgi:HK97 family phage prohead protease